MNRTTVVTTFSPTNWRRYASRTIPTWLEYFNRDADFHFHCDRPVVEDARITYFSSSALKTEFIDRNQRLRRVFPVPGAKGFATRWETYCHKVFAQCESAFKTNSRFLLYLDADVAVLKSLPAGLLEDQLDRSFCGYIGRTTPCTETGFILYDLWRDPQRTFFATFVHEYLSDRLFEFDDGWDDCHVFDRCRLQSRLPFKNLSGQYTDSLDPIALGPLGEYFDHWIGKASKKQGTSQFRHLRGA
ncbi:MAG: hypothetical protein ABL986_06635 [Vicinamibacterales bacterium]